MPSLACHHFATCLGHKLYHLLTQAEPKTSNNGRISENKVLQITNKKFFSIKSKMGTAYGFHIDLKFQADLPWLSGLQMAQAPRIARLGPAPTRMFESGIFHFLMVFYEYLQLWKVVDLKYLQLCVKKTTLRCTCNVS